MSLFITDIVVCWMVHFS